MQLSALHPKSRAILGSWQNLNGLSDAEPSEKTADYDNSELIERLFMAQRVQEGVFSFRTFGKELKVWTGRDLRDHEIGSLFYGPDKVLIRALLESCITNKNPAIARIAAFGAGFGQRTEIEIVFLPLIDKNNPERILGLFQPLANEIKISRPALRFAITALIPPDPAFPSNPGLRLVK